MLFQVGRVCKKIAGREAGRVCVVISKKEGSFVTIDGDLRRRKSNVSHLEPLGQVVEIKENADTKSVLSALKNAGFDVQGKKEKTDKKVGPKPKKKRKQKKKEEKKTEKKTKNKKKSKK